jgi:hypothetical protein
VGTSAKVYTASSPEGSKFGTAGSVRLDLSGTSFQSVATGTTGKVTRKSGMFTVSGTTYTRTETCSDPLVDGGVAALETGGYTATATTLTLYNNGGAFLVEITLTKQ